MRIWRVFPATFLKRDSSTGIFCQFCEIFKNISFGLSPDLERSPLLLKLLAVNGNNTDSSENKPHLRDFEICFPEV